VEEVLEKKKNYILVSDSIYKNNYLDNAIFLLK